MNLDLLTLLENIVSGFVSFFYSLARSLYLTARHPVRGPFRLYRLYRAPKSRQIGGVTFLCLGFFLMFYVLPGATDLAPRSLIDQVVSAIRELPNSSARKLWPVLAASLASTIVIDAAIRFFLDFRRLRRSRRDEALAAAEYALFWATLPAVMGAIVAEFWMHPLFGGSAGVDPRALALVPAAALLALPAATILDWATRRGANGVRRRSTGRLLAVLGGLTAVLFVAAYAGTTMWAAITG